MVNLTLTIEGIKVLEKHILLDKEKIKILESQLSTEEQQLIEKAFSLLAKEAKYAFPR